MTAATDNAMRTKPKKGFIRTSDRQAPGKPAGRRSGSTTAHQGAAIGFAMPALLFVVLIMYVPFLWTSFISFTKYNGLGSPEWIGFSNYVQMFKDPFFLSSVLHTIMWVIGTIVVPVGVGLVLAVLTYGTRWGSWLRMPFLIPYAISGVAVGVIWQFVLQTGGALSQALEFLHMPGSDLRWLLDSPLNTFMMIGASAWQSTGVNALLFVVGLQSIPKEPLEAARLDGATGIRLFTSMIWPMLRPLTTVVVGLAIVGSLKTFDVVWSMTQGGPGRNSETLAVTMFKETFVATQYGVGSAVALVLTLVTMIASVLYIRQQLSPRHDF